jgi:hypothetical protein
LDDGAGGSFLGLSPNVRLEQLDPAHRSDFEDHEEFTCGTAFQEWVANRNGEQNVPFFLWLENNAICLRDSKEGLNTHQVVQLSKNNRRADAQFKLRLVTIFGGLRMQELGGIDARLKTASTKGYHAAHDKDTRANPPWRGDDVAAFVWSAKHNEFFIAEHTPGCFHHSSFESGGHVRCAGMIVIGNGVATMVNNNSGHYKPRKEHLVKFVNQLQMFGGIAANAEVGCVLDDGKQFRGTPAAFLAVPRWVRAEHR